MDNYSLVSVIICTETRMAKHAQGEFFRTAVPNVEGNTKLRDPQVGAYSALRDHYGVAASERETCVILPVGCGKSGIICLAPFATRARRALVIAPYVQLADQLRDDFDPAKTDHYFYGLRGVLTPDQGFPEPVEIRGKKTNRADLDEADVVITNIDQIEGAENRWLTTLPNDFFDLILLDEGHHSVAESWTVLKAAFPDARIVNFSATPKRADGRLMPGKVVYTYSVRQAIERGFVKNLKALVLNPDSLRFVREENGREEEVALDEVIRLGEEDSRFRRSIVSSKETLDTIANASIVELRRLRGLTGEGRLKIIASALNYEHCSQVVRAYRERGLLADFVHANETGKRNQAVLQRLANHELDVIVQVRKLGEGFDHPLLGVAAVFSVFSELSPFVQFVGRIMRSIVSGNPTHVLNQGTVVYHAGSNVAKRWKDFQEFSDADREFFDHLLPEESFNFKDGDAILLDPLTGTCQTESIEVRDQSDVRVAEVPLIETDPEALKAFEVLRSKGFSAEDFERALKNVPVTKQAARRAEQASLDQSITNEAGRILRAHGSNPKGHELDKRRLGRENFQVVKSAIDTAVNQSLGRGKGKRADLSKAELDSALTALPAVCKKVEEEFFNGA